MGLLIEAIIKGIRESMIRIISCAVIITILTVFNSSLIAHGVGQFLDKTMATFILAFALVYALAFQHKAAFHRNFGNGAIKAGWVFGLMSLIFTTNSPLLCGSAHEENQNVILWCGFVCAV